MRAELNAAHSTTCDRTASSSPSAHYLTDHYTADSHAVDNRGPVTFSRPPQEVSFRVSSLLYIARWPYADIATTMIYVHHVPQHDTADRLSARLARTSTAAAALDRAVQVAEGESAV